MVCAHLGPQRRGVARAGADNAGNNVSWRRLEGKPGASMPPALARPRISPIRMMNIYNTFTQWRILCQIYDYPHLTVGVYITVIP
jgi:hypothetical protein